MKQIMVTGADGFVGTALCRKLVADGYAVRGAVWELALVTDHNKISGVDYIEVGGIDGETDWRDAVEGIETVIHLAARVHVMHETTGDPLAEFRKVNCDGSANLAAQCAAMDVIRLVYVSTVKVSGEKTTDEPLHEEVMAKPQEPYAISKWEAEEILCKISQETGLELVIVRPPLIYGPGVKANFLRMIRWIDKGLPLPLGGIHNKRSLIGLSNFADFLALCAMKPEAKGEVFFVSDDDDVSTSELLRRVAVALGKPCKIFWFPSMLLRAAALLLGQKAAADRLLGSLELDISKAKTKLGWQPPSSMAEELQATADWYLASKGTAT
ncbi:MAG: NAD-dependent epimerase/dehydratase family protein [Planctomycetes bacterium]|nr:NAD-dependent epimerase/dehydratase family protein [Planctomycetota bacterium]